MGKDQRMLSELCGKSASEVRGCFVEKVEVDYGRLKLPLTPEDQLQPVQLLALSTIDNALLDSPIQKGGRVAVLIGLGTDMELHRHRARVALRERMGISPGDELTAEQEKLLNYVSDVSTSTSYTSNIGNIVATRTAASWGFTGPCFTTTQGANSVYRCLELARLMMARGEIEGAVIGGVDLAGDDDCDIGEKSWAVRAALDDGCAALDENDQPRLDEINREMASLREEQGALVDAWESERGRVEEIRRRAARRDDDGE